MAKAHNPYQRLEQERCLDEDDDDIREHVIGGLRNSNPCRFRRVHMRRKGKKLRIRLPCRLTRKPSLINIAWTKLCTRFKECRSHFGELFAGNYLFLQVAPSSAAAHHNNGRSIVRNA